MAASDMCIPYPPPLQTDTNKLKAPNSSTGDAKSLILLAYDSGLYSSKHLSHTRTRMLFFFNRPESEEDANYSHRISFLSPLHAHRRTLAHELATYVSYARCHVAEEKENGVFFL